MKRFFFLFALFTATLFSFRPKELNWIAFGDSITYLNDHQNETGNRVTKGYMTLVTENMPAIHFVNQGHNGWTAGMIAQKFDTLGIGKADIYSVFLGTNDWWAGRPLGTLKDYRQNAGNGTIYGSYRIIINKIKALNPTAHIVLISPMQRTDFVYINDYKNNAFGSYKSKANQTLEQVVNAIDSIGTIENIATIDLFHDKKLSFDKLVKFKLLKNPTNGTYTKYKYPNYIGLPFNPLTDEYPYPPEAENLTFDGLHPSDKGYRVIAARLIAIFKNL